MESAGSAVVDFGRFCTAFLVVMGIGMRESLACLEYKAPRKLFGSIER